MTDKQIDRWLRGRFTQVGWVLIAYNLMMNVLVILELYVSRVIQTLQMFTGSKEEPAAIMDNAWGYIVTTLAGILILLAWKGSGYWRHEILEKRGRMRPGVFLSLLCFSVGAQMVNSIWIMVLEWVLNQFGLSSMYVLEKISGASYTFSMFLYSSVLAPIAEELLFRGYVLRSLRPFGKRFAVWGSAILFGLFHGNLLQTPYAILMGLILGYVTVEYSIGWAVMIHLFVNLVLADLLTRLTAAWSDIAYSMLNLILLGGGLLISLVILIRKREAIREYRHSEWIDRRVLKCFFLNSGILVLSAIALVSMISLLFM